MHFKFSLDYLPPSQIPKVLNPPKDVFNRYFVAQAAPVVIVGSSIMRGRLSCLNDLSEEAQNIEVNVRSGDYKDVGQRQQQKMRLADFVEQKLLNKNCGLEDFGKSDYLPHYAGNTPLNERHFARLGLIQPNLLECKGFDQPRLWLGAKGSLTPLHYDTRDNLIGQYIGRKHFTLFPPSQIRCLYTHGYAPARSSVADPRRQDLNRYPRFAEARSVEFTLNAGEILYLPARWSHFVVNLEISLMVNFWPEYSWSQLALLGLRNKLRGLKHRLS